MPAVTDEIVHHTKKRPGFKLLKMNGAHISDFIFKIDNIFIIFFLDNQLLVCNVISKNWKCSKIGELKKNSEKIGEKS